MGENETEFVTVLTTGNPGVLAVAEALLRGEGIEYYMRNTAMQRLFPVDGFTLASAQIVVRAEDSEAASEALSEIREYPDDAEAD